MGIIAILICIIVPFILIGTGQMCKSLSYGDFDNISGYRTKKAVKNQDTWKEANNYFSEAILKTCQWYIIITMSSGFIFNNDFGMVVIINSLLCIPTILIAVIKTEYYLKKTFNKDGIKIL